MTSSGFMVLYGFDFECETLHVFDPKRCTGGRELLESIHFDICDKLLQGMADCIESCFDGWEVDQPKWKFVCHEYLNEPIARYHIPVLAHVTSIRTYKQKVLYEAPD
jgi:hypothetical protein